MLLVFLGKELNKNEFIKGVEKAVNVVRGVIHKSIENPIMGKEEISIVASKSIIENPPIEVKAEIIQE